MNEILNSILKKLSRQESLDKSESNFLVKQIFNDEINDICLSSILTFLFQKGESFEEIQSFVLFLKKKSKKLNLGNNLMDTCGTGGDNKNSFNFSTATSIVLSSFDVKIAKHGNRSITSKSGSCDVLESLGVKLYDTPFKIERFYKKHGIAFIFAPYFHPILKKVAHIRKSLFFRTIFNLLGPLLNPCILTYQLIGVSDIKNLETHSQCLSNLKIKKAWVVNNNNGYDELTTTSENRIVEIIRGKKPRTKLLDPRELGLDRHSENDLKGGDASENAFLMRKAFEGETGAIRDNITLNSAAGLVVCERAKNIKEGLEMVNYNINNGVVINKLNSLIKG